MASTHKRPRAASAASRTSSLDLHHEHRSHQVDAKVGTKRTFSNRESRRSLGAEDYSENGERETSDGVEHSGKRQRSSGWPFPNTPSNSSATRPPLQNRKTPNSPSSVHRPSSQAARSSRFVEGSMNDRASQKPPPTYTGTEEELRSRFDYDEQVDIRGRKLARPRKPTARGNTSSVGGSEGSRQSGIFRFGKTLASSFNPTNWRIWSKQQPPVLEDEGETERLRVLRERKETAERMYKELKAAGKFQSGSVRGRSVGPRDSQPGTGAGILHGKHDSGFDTGSIRGRMSMDMPRGRVSRETSREDKRKGRVFLEPPKIFRDRRDESPASFAGSLATSAVETPSKQSLHFKKPSLSSIKNAFSNSNDLAAEGHSQYPVPRIPSRKELEKQQKLVKRVSDLESKLDAARRQLSETLNEPFPEQPAKMGRSRFVPGALASLPSERLLAGYVGADAGVSDNESRASIGKAVTGEYNKDEEIEQDFVGPSPTPSWLGGRLAPQDRVLQSVERDESVQENAASEVGQQTVVSMISTISEPSTGFVDDPKDDDYVEEESDEDFPMRDSAKPSSAQKASPKNTTAKNITPMNTPPKKSQTKKRKSTFERMADDGGVYKPTGDTDSEAESEVKKPTPRKNNNGTRPRKLQKTVQEANNSPNTNNTTSKSGPGKVPTRPPPPVPGRQNSVKGMKKLISPPPPGQTSNLPQKGKQSFSPPPSSNFTGLDYMKPSVAREKQQQTQTVKHVGEVVGNLNGNRDNSFYTADPTTDDTVPPVPDIPKELRLPSGEVIKTKSSSLGSKAGSDVSRASKPGKLTKARPAAKEKDIKKLEFDKDFNWDKDTF